MKQLFCLPNIQVCAFLAALDCIHNVTLFASRYFVLWVDKLLPKGVGGLEVHQDDLFIDNLPELLKKLFNMQSSLTCSENYPQEEKRPFTHGH